MPSATCQAQLHSPDSRTSLGPTNQRWVRLRTSAQLFQGKWIAQPTLQVASINIWDLRNEQHLRLVVYEFHSTMACLSGAASAAPSPHSRLVVVLISTVWRDATMARLLQNLVDPPSPVAWMPLTMPRSCVLLHSYMKWCYRQISRERERERAKKKCPALDQLLAAVVLCLWGGGLVAMMRFIKPWHRNGTKDPSKQIWNLSEMISGVVAIYGPARLLARWGGCSKVRQNGWCCSSP